MCPPGFLQHRFRPRVGITCTCLPSVCSSFYTTTLTVLGNCPNLKRTPLMTPGLTNQNTTPLWSHVMQSHWN